METTKPAVGEKIHIISYDNSECPSRPVIRKTLVARGGGKGYIRIAEGSDRLMVDEGKTWARASDVGAVERLNDIVATENAKIDATQKRRAETLAEQERERVEKERARKLREQQEADERVADLLQRAAKAVAAANVPEDLRSDAFRFAVAELQPRGAWMPFIYR